MAKDPEGNIGVLETFYFYKSRSDHPVNITQFRRIYDAIVHKMVEKLFEGKSIMLPHFIGGIKIQKHKQNYTGVLKLDYGTFRKTGEKVEHLNIHTNGFYYKFLWNKGICKLPNKEKASFTPSRWNKRRLAAVLKDPNRSVEYSQEYCI